MAKEYTRYCDVCKKEIKKLYDFGVTTIYQRIRVGRGCMIKDYEDNSIYNLVEEKKPDDYDSYGTSWNNDKDKEFSFCCPDCLFKFLTKIYEDTYNSSIESIKKKKVEDIDITFKEFKRKFGEKISFFTKIQTKFSKDFFRSNLLAEIRDLKKELNKMQKKIEESKDDVKKNLPE